jgi:hypothetical protein
MHRLFGFTIYEALPDEVIRSINHENFLVFSCKRRHFYPLAMNSTESCELEHFRQQSVTDNKQENHLAFPGRVIHTYRK